MKKICILSWRDVSSAYSCLFYLKNSLMKNYENVSMWARTPRNRIDKDKCVGYYSFHDSWYGHIRFFRKYIGRIHALLIAKKNDIIIINDLDFFRVGYYIKKMYPKKKIIHYNTEIHGTDVKYSKNIVKFYERHADYPDMIIECLKERAEYRKETFGIKKKIYVINNTLPLKEIESESFSETDEKYNVDEYLKFDKKLPILIYAGGCNLSRNLGDVIKSAGEFRDQLNYLFFCYGNDNDFAMVKKEGEKYENCKIYKAVNRSELLKIMRRCDIGVQYYDPDVSVNHYLASPSKLYEYIGVGLNIISSNNHGIDKIIQDNKIGVCFSKEEGIVRGIRKLLNQGLQDKLYIREIFKEKYCYEIDSEEALKEIQKIIEMD